MKDVVNTKVVKNWVVLNIGLQPEKGFINKAIRETEKLYNTKVYSLDVLPLKNAKGQNWDDDNTLVLRFSTSKAHELRAVALSERLGEDAVSYKVDHKDGKLAFSRHYKGETFEFNNDFFID